MVSYFHFLKNSGSCILYKLKLFEGKEKNVNVEMSCISETHWLSVTPQVHTQVKSNRYICIGLLYSTYIYDTGLVPDILAVFVIILHFPKVFSTAPWRVGNAIMVCWEPRLFRLGWDMVFGFSLWQTGEKMRHLYNGLLWSTLAVPPKALYFLASLRWLSLPNHPFMYHLA